MKKKSIIIISIILVGLLSGCIYYFCNYDPTLVDLNDVQTDHEYINVTYNQEENILEEDILGILTIEKIRIEC